jgi:hypothetical protein
MGIGTSDLAGWSKIGAVMKLQLTVIALLGSAGLNLAPRAQQPAAPQGWQELQPADSFGESRRQFTLAGKFLPPFPANPAANLEDNPANSPTPPALLLKCAPSRRYPGKMRFRVGAVVVGVPLDIHMVEPPERKGGISYYPEVSVSYRLDEGKPFKDEWPPRYDKVSVEFDKPTFKKILRAHNFLITVPDKDGHELRIQFDMPDSSAGPLTTAQVAEACGVPDLKK